MKTHSSFRKRGFTLLETVIAIGVLAVLLTGFMVVFAPAAAGIRKAINVQEADRLTSTLEQELVTFRKGNESGLPAKTSTVYTGFDKAFGWIMKSNSAADALLVYQYRGSLTDAPRTDDNTPAPVPAKDLRGKVAGKDYSLQTMLRRKSDSKFMQDLEAVEGGVYLVKCTQLVFDTTKGGMVVGKAGEIIDPKGSAKATSADDYPEAVIAFSAEFFNLPAKSASFFDSSTNFSKAFTAAKTPVFTRNLAVRR
jgi:prepilin-type N-terminal cleavage/methylation domain-containing protein